MVKKLILVHEGYVTQRTSPQRDRAGWRQRSLWVAHAVRTETSWNLITDINDATTPFMRPAGAGNCLFNTFRYVFYCPALCLSGHFARRFLLRWMFFEWNNTLCSSDPFFPKLVWVSFKPTTLKLDFLCGATALVLYKSSTSRYWSSLERWLLNFLRIQLPVAIV